ncbi:hypothetical protein DXV75_06110 [Alteromonas aestuariivivens]|uniref:Uncharacterized protein n=2 Tax=Alteromonas aestuariivivens TaxID=1938339 RepID=A0A3D8M964_9ALTE|nr:hypothetical protein DXV75_06110 [Alteromonas aestuariivivens]
MGVTHLFVTFYFDEQALNEFAAFGITLIFLPCISAMGIKTSSGKLANVRPMGKTGSTLELTLHDLGNIERVEADDGRVVFSSCAPLERIEVDASDNLCNKFIEEFISSADVLVCRGSNEVQVKMVCKCIELGVLPVLPSDDINELAFLPDNFHRLISRIWKKLYFSPNPNENLSVSINEFNESRQFLNCYSKENEQYIRVLLEFAFSFLH